MSGLVLDATGLVPGSRTRQVHSYFRTAAGVLLFCAGYYVGAMAGIALGFPRLLALEIQK